MTQNHLESGVSLVEMFQYFQRLYGDRNHRGLPKLLHRVAFMDIGVNDLEEALRKKDGSEENFRHLEVAMARVVSRVFCVADFLQQDFVTPMARKYPMKECAYCHRNPCRCQERRNSANMIPEAHPLQLEWSLGIWCGHSDVLYGERNRQKGVDHCLGRLYHEVAELMGPALELELYEVELIPEDVIHEMLFEIADVLMWTAAVANLEGVELENVVIRRYGLGCWNCHQLPCVCPDQFNTRPVHWSSVQRKHPDHLK